MIASRMTRPAAQDPDQQAKHQEHGRHYEDGAYDPTDLLHLILDDVLLIEDHVEIGGGALRFRI